MMHEIWTMNVYLIVWYVYDFTAMLYCIVFISMIGVFWHTLNKDFRGLKGGKRDKLDQLV